MQKNDNYEADKLVLEARKNLSLTGVQTVDGFTNQCLKLTVSGEKVVISGSDLKITSFNKNTGVLSCNGLVNEIKYNLKKQPFIKRIFK